MREEWPIIESNISKIYEDEKLLVIDKPASWVCHSAGKYRFNTVSNIMRFEHKYDDVCMLHRLDRVTSGVLLLAKHPIFAS